MQANNIPLKCKRLEGDHFYVEISPGNEFCNLHFMNFLKDGNNFTADVVIGMKPEPPYQLVSFKLNMHFKQFQDGTWAVRMFMNHFIQFAQCEDFRDTLVKSVIEGHNKGFMEHVTEF